MWKRLAGILLIFAVLSIGGTGTANAVHGVPSTYTSEYGVTNFYATDVVLDYHFSDLDAGTDYIWLMQGIDETGNGTVALASKFFTGGVSTTQTWSGILGDFDLENGTLYQGPARVVDNFGNELGRHYVLSGCSRNVDFECGVPTPCWIDTCTANNPADDRNGIGRHFNLHDEDLNGWFHDATDDLGDVITLHGDFTILHYRFNPAGEGTDEIRLYDLETTTQVARFEIADLIAYNTDIRNSVLTPWFPYQSFVVLNTDGSDLDGFINQEQEIGVFNQPGAGDNPHEMSFDKGGYDYAHVTSVNVLVAEGESHWLVGDKTIDEWQIVNSTQSIESAGTLNFELLSTTEEIWDAGYSDHELIDSALGTIDSVDYIYIPHRHDNYVVDVVVDVTETTTWTIDPLFSNMPGMVLAERNFIVSFDYVISPDLTPSDRIEKTLNGLGLDTPLGRTLGMLLIMGVVAIMVVTRSRVRGIVPFGLIFIIIGGAWLALGMGDILTVILFGIAAIVLLILMVNSNRKNEGF